LDREVQSRFRGFKGSKGSRFKRVQGSRRSNVQEFAEGGVYG
jgi:hypothetical protein